MKSAAACRYGGAEQDVYLFHGIVSEWIDTISYRLNMINIF